MTDVDMAIIGAGFLTLLIVFLIFRTEQDTKDWVSWASLAIAMVILWTLALT